MTPNGKPAGPNLGSVNGIPIKSKIEIVVLANGQLVARAFVHSMFEFHGMMGMGGRQIEESLKERMEQGPQLEIARPGDIPPLT